MKEIKILLIGQPNVGKSSLLNALAGSNVLVSNYPGTTVEIIQAEKISGNTKINFVDTPKIYSISDVSKEEEITEEALFRQKMDGVVVVADATSIKSGLYLTLQMLEAGVPTVLAVNFVEEARKQGTEIDCQKLEELLNVPVVPVNPFSKEGVEKLVGSVLHIAKKKNVFNAEYEDYIEKAISIISRKIKNREGLPKRFIALRILERDEDFYGYLENEEFVKEIKKSLSGYPKMAADISITRYKTASFIAEKVTRKTPLKKVVRLQERIDNIFLHKSWGSIVTGFLLLFIFGTLLYLGNWLENILMDWTNNFLSFLNIGRDSIFGIVSYHAITGLTAGISIALPYVFLFYLFLGLLEDTGLLSRFVINAERSFKRIGLSGQSLIPLALGLGCTVPAVRATRILSSKKEQFYTASLLAFVPCSSRIAIIMGIVGFYGGISLAFGVLATLIFAGFVWQLGLKKVFHLKSKPLFLELPPYRKPLIQNILAKSWVRMRDFVYIAIPLFIFGGIAYGLTDALAFTNTMVSPFSWITKWLSLPNKAIIPLVFGFLQKNLVGSMLVSTLGSEISLVLAPIQLYTFGVASTIGVPCIMASGMFWKEFGLKKTIILIGVSTTYGFLLAGLISRFILMLA